MSDAIYDGLMRRHWLFRVVPVSLWSVRCNGTCASTDPHAAHLSPLFLWMLRRSSR